MGKADMKKEEPTKEGLGGLFGKKEEVPSKQEGGLGGLFAKKEETPAAGGLGGLFANKKPSGGGGLGGMGAKLLGGMKKNLVGSEADI